ncbi:hypothetical protein AB0383_25255 [Amycolatopsis sp. NPDC051373]|uniref:hypothetical protein n=1 Tax=Amycolatopsis sp. NPDC051373 TaxID=3155801 RepID=UPI00344F827C
MDQALAAQGFPASAPSSADLEHACDTTKPGAGTFGLDLQDGQSYDTNFANPASTQTGHVRDRLAVLQLETNHQAGTCAVSIEVKPKSRAIVFGALTSTDTDQACIQTRKVAEAVELLLPKNT